MTSTGYLVAHYDMMDPKEVNYRSSGGMFVVVESWCNMAVGTFLFSPSHSRSFPDRRLLQNSSQR
jgi:hypothetical protein